MSSNPLDFVDWVLSVRSAAVVSGYHDSLLQARPWTTIPRCPDVSSHLIPNTHVPFVYVYSIKIRSHFTIFIWHLYKYLLYLYSWPILIQERWQKACLQLWVSGLHVCCFFNWLEDQAVHEGLNFTMPANFATFWSSALGRLPTTKCQSGRNPMWACGQLIVFELPWTSHIWPWKYIMHFLFGIDGVR